MADRTCLRCNKVFNHPCRLKTHMSRKTPCTTLTAPIAKNARYVCQRCYISFTTQQAHSRHTLHRCKVTNTTEKPSTEHSIQLQLAAVQTQNAEIKAQMSELKTLLKCQPQALNVNSNNNVNVTQVVNITPWAPNEALIRASDLAAIFAENPRLDEYCHFSDADKVDAEGAAPYILEALMEFVKRAHADPSARNIYLNPRRSDQVLVFAEEAGGSWKTLSLTEGIRALFDGVTGGIKHTIGQTQTLMELPCQLVGAASFVPLLYDDEPDSYVKRAKGQMAAHLTNTAPSAETRVVLAQRPVRENKCTTTT
jgi:hypothetical protein